jgi:quinol-cytochrome oxidoreductase complex cytochrome b subunit
MKSHLESYPCPLQINSFWNLGFLLGITIILQIITGIFLGLHYTSDLNSAYSSLFFFIREIFYGWSLRYLHSSGASFVFLFLFLHLGRAISYGSYFYNPNTWFSGIIIFFFLMVVESLWCRSSSHELSRSEQFSGEHNEELLIGYQSLLINLLRTNREST